MRLNLNLSVLPFEVCLSKYSGTVSNYSLLADFRFWRLVICGDPAVPWSKTEAPSIVSPQWYLCRIAFVIWAFGVGGYLSNTQTRRRTLISEAYDSALDFKPLTARDDRSVSFCQPPTSSSCGGSRAADLFCSLDLCKDYLPSGGYRVRFPVHALGVCSACIHVCSLCRSVAASLPSITLLRLASKFPSSSIMDQGMY